MRAVLVVVTALASIGAGAYLIASAVATRDGVATERTLGFEPAEGLW